MTHSNAGRRHRRGAIRVADGSHLRARRRFGLVVLLLFAAAGCRASDGASRPAAPEVGAAPIAASGEARQSGRRHRQALRDRLQKARAANAARLTALSPEERVRLEAERSKAKGEVRERAAAQLASPTASVRRRAIAELDPESPDGADERRLRDLLSGDPDAEVRAAAAAQLAFASSLGSAQSLLAALRDDDPRVVMAALDSLGFVGDDTIVADLRPLLQHPDEGVRRRAAATIDFLE